MGWKVAIHGSSGVWIWVIRHRSWVDRYVDMGPQVESSGTRSLVAVCGTLLPTGWPNRPLNPLLPVRFAHGRHVWELRRPDDAMFRLPKVAFYGTADRSPFVGLGLAAR